MDGSFYRPVLKMDAVGHVAAAREVAAVQAVEGHLDERSYWHADQMRRRQEEFCSRYIRVGTWTSCWREGDGQLYWTTAEL